MSSLVKAMQGVHNPHALDNKFLAVNRLKVLAQAICDAKNREPLSFEMLRQYHILACNNQPGVNPGKLRMLGYTCPDISTSYNVDTILELLQLIQEEGVAPYGSFLTTEKADGVLDEENKINGERLKGLTDVELHDLAKKLDSNTDGLRFIPRRYLGEVDEYFTLYAYMVELDLMKELSNQLRMLEQEV